MSFELSSCARDTEAKYLSAKAEAIQELSAKSFSSPEEKLKFLKSEVYKVEQMFLPAQGTSRQEVVIRYGEGIDASETKDLTKKSHDYIAYELVSGVVMFITYKDNKVTNAHIVYQSLGFGSKTVYRSKSRPLKIQTLDEDRKEQVDDAEFDYIGAQILLKTYRKHQSSVLDTTSSNRN